MSRQMVWSQQAERQLDELHDHISEHSTVNADRFVLRILSTAESLHAFPERGRRVPESLSDELHELHVGRYRLIYRITSDNIRILALWHGARALANRLHELEWDQ
jgi:plasmid stabilization system protein ParE